MGEDGVGWNRMGWDRMGEDRMGWERIGWDQLFEVRGLLGKEPLNNTQKRTAQNSNIRSESFILSPTYISIFFIPPLYLVLFTSTIPNHRFFQLISCRTSAFLSSPLLPSPYNCLSRLIRFNLTSLTHLTRHQIFPPSVLHLIKISKLAGMCVDFIFQAFLNASSLAFD